MIIVFFLAILYFFWLLSRALRARVNPEKLERNLRDMLRQGKAKEALELCEGTKKPLTRALSVVLRTRGRREDLADPLANNILQSEQVHFARSLGRLKLFAVLLVIMGVLAPLPDFIHAIQSLEISSGFDRTLFAMGISDALTFVSTGLWMCIVLIIGYAVLEFFVRKMFFDMNESYLRFKAFLTSQPDTDE